MNFLCIFFTVMEGIANFILKSVIRTIIKCSAYARQQGELSLTLE